MGTLKCHWSLKFFESLQSQESPKSTIGFEWFYGYDPVMNCTKFLFAIAVASITLFDMSASAQSKPATTPPASSKTAKPIKPPAKVAPKVAASKAEPAATAPVIATEKPKTVYVVPMGLKDKGQFGLDIHPQVYEQIAKDIAEKRPDIVVFVLNSADIDSVRYLGDDPRKFGIFDDDGIRKMSRNLKEVIQKVGAEPIMIVRDAVGYSVLLGLNWENMYMTESSRLMGLERIKERTQAADPEVYAKFREAMVAICNGLLIAGGYDPAIGLAMMREEKMLSASFKGREITWSDDANGTWVVDGSTDRITAHFSPEMAEELGLSDGTVSDDDATMIEDVMYLRGNRSYILLAEDGKKIVSEYIAGWRAGLEDCRKAYEQYLEAIGEAQGNNEKKNLAKGKSHLQKILSTIKKYQAIEIALQRIGVSKVQIITEILQLDERIRGLSKSTSPPGGSGKSGGGLGAGSSILVFP